MSEPKIKREAEAIDWLNAFYVAYKRAMGREGPTAKSAVEDLRRMIENHFKFEAYKARAAARGVKIIL
jgi:hypothetical protein